MNLKDKYRALLGAFSQQEKPKVNLFNKDIGYGIDLNYNSYRLGTSAGNLYLSYTRGFISHYIEVENLKTYMLKREPLNATTPAYNRWVLFDENKNPIIFSSGSTTNETFVEINDSRVKYIRFNGLISDVENIEFTLN